jgi:hypothetical protein
MISSGLYEFLSVDFLQKPVLCIRFPIQYLIEILNEITGSTGLLVKIASGCVDLS